MSAYYVRPVKLGDLQGLMKLIRSMKTGVASLPNDREVIEGKIKKSQKAFKGSIKNGVYLFVLIKEEDESVIGVSGIYAQAGGRDSFFTYKLEREVFEHKPFGLKKEVGVLKLTEIKDSVSELCSLYLSSRYRHSGNGVVLAFSRYLYMKGNREVFSDDLIANLRGYRNVRGFSPFWRGLGKRFFEGKLRKADEMKSQGEKAFIRDLMPKAPIYVELLPTRAQKVVGEVHRESRPAKRLLEKLGFEWHGKVDIFDAGPMLESKTDNVSIMCKAKEEQFAGVLKNEGKGKTALIARAGGEFRCCLGKVFKKRGGGLMLSQQAARLLKLEGEETLVYYTL